MKLFGPTAEEQELQSRVDKLEQALFDALVAYTWSLFTLGHNPPITLPTLLHDSKYSSEEVIEEATRRYNLNRHPDKRI